MTFTTNKLIVTKNKIEQHSTFLKVEDVPGYEDLVKDEMSQVINFLHCNLENRDLCLQAVKHRNTNDLVYSRTGSLVAAHGWQVSQTLGKGKDGTTVLAHRFGDEKKELKTVKFLSKHAQNYSNHTNLFNEILLRVKKKNQGFFELAINDSYTYYNNSVQLKSINSDSFDKILVKLCNLNSWSIKHTGFVFWDFGFGSGRNYMLDHKGVLKWIDYGGSGILRCPNFESIYAQHKTLPAIELTTPYDDKQSLIFANSNFIMCQFLLHIEYWNNTKNTNADIWSSMLQIRTSVIDETANILNSLISTTIAKKIYNEFKSQDWTDNITWKQVGKYIDANT